MHPFRRVAPFLPMMLFPKFGNFEVRAVLYLTAIKAENLVYIADQNAIGDEPFRFCVEVGIIFDGFRNAEIVVSAILANFGLKHGNKPI